MVKQRERLLPPPSVQVSLRYVSRAILLLIYKLLCLFISASAISKPVRIAPKPVVETGCQTTSRFRRVQPYKRRAIYRDVTMLDDHRGTVELIDSFTQTRKRRTRVKKARQKTSVSIQCDVFTDFAHNLVCYI